MFSNAHFSYYLLNSHNGCVKETVLHAIITIQTTTYYLKCKTMFVFDGKLLLYLADIDDVLFRKKLVCFKQKKKKKDLL